MAKGPVVAAFTAPAVSAAGTGGGGVRVLPEDVVEALAGRASGSAAGTNKGPEKWLLPALQCRKFRALGFSSATA